MNLNMNILFKCLKLTKQRSSQNSCCIQKNSRQIVLFSLLSASKLFSLMGILFFLCYATGLIIAIFLLLLWLFRSSTKHILGGLSTLEIIRRMSVETDHLLSPSELGSKVTSKIDIILSSGNVVVGF